MTHRFHVMRAERRARRESRVREEATTTKEEGMTSIKVIVGLLLAAVAAVVGVVAFGAAQASASSAPIVITYTKTCSGGTCAGTTGDGDTLAMQVTSLQATGKAAQLTATEEITGGSFEFTAELNGHRTPAGFIVLNGTVTSGPYAGAQVHQRSNLTGVDGTATVWAGELRIMPASA
jgi:hypothetical protein